MTYEQRLRQTAEALQPLCFPVSIWLMNAGKPKLKSASYLYKQKMVAINKTIPIAEEVVKRESERAIHALNYSGRTDTAIRAYIEYQGLNIPKKEQHENKP
jgi:hypothetical protein